MSGYSNPEFDRICSTTNSTIPGMTEHAVLHLASQAVFKQYLPSLPLYLRPGWVITRSDIDGVEGDPPAGNSLRDIEAFEDGEGCSPTR